MGNVFRYLILFMLCKISAESEWNSKDYLKREFSLVKPYSGFFVECFFLYIWTSDPRGVGWRSISKHAGADAGTALLAADASSAVPASVHAS